MMKKNGFTLAEVLITLAIIGVVATMTLPALITNTGEQQAKTGLKKAVNTLTEAAKMNEALLGYDFGNLNASKKAINESEADDTQTIEALLRARTTIDYAATGNGKTSPFGGKKPTANTQAHGNVDRYVVFKDGIIMMYANKDVSNADNKKMSTVDGLPVGFSITIDTNGVKGPNVLSNCLKTGASKAGANDYSSGEEEDAVGNSPTICNENKAYRFIGDRFQLKVRGSVIEPMGPAATWAMQN